MQDTFNKIIVSFSKCGPSSGFALDGFIVIATGSIDYNTFEVEKIQQPIVFKEEIDTELDKEVKDCFGSKEKFLGVMGKLTQIQNKDDQHTKAEKMKKIKISQEVQREFGIYTFNSSQKRAFEHGSQKNESQQNASFSIEDLGNENVTIGPLQKSGYIVSNVILDSEDMLQNLEKLILSFTLTRPLMLVLCGPLFSFKDLQTSYHMSVIKSCLQNLYNLFVKNEKLLKDTFIVMLPDVYDFGLNQLPKKPYPEFLFQNFLNKFPLFYLAENPFRFSVFNKDYVISRTDM